MLLRVEQGGVHATAQLDELLDLALRIDLEYANEGALHGRGGQPLRGLVHGQAGDLVLVRLEYTRRLGRAVLCQAYVLELNHEFKNFNQEKCPYLKIYSALHETGFDGGKAEQLTIVVIGRDLA